MDGAAFWKRVKAEVNRQNTSFEWLYDKARIPKGTLASWKSRNTLPRADEAYRIAQALEVSVEYLLTGFIAAPPVIKRGTIIEEINIQILRFDDIDLSAMASLAEMLSRRYD